MKVKWAVLGITSNEFAFLYNVGTMYMDSFKDSLRRNFLLYCFEYYLEVVSLINLIKQQMPLLAYCYI